METIQKNKTLWMLLLVGTFCVSCNDKMEFSQYKTIKNSSWQTSDKISFNFNITDTLAPKNLFINIRNNSAYEFSNLYLITALKFPDSTKVVDTLQYKMADETGAYLGSGFSEIKENKLFYKERKIFPKSGSYSIEISQAMRKNGEVEPLNNLEGIQDVGFSIEKIDK